MKVGPLQPKTYFELGEEEGGREQAYKCDGSYELEVRTAQPEADSPVGDRHLAGRYTWHSLNYLV
jgi:hypothetical protein